MKIFLRGDIKNPDNSRELPELFDHPLFERNLLREIAEFASYDCTAFRKKDIEESRKKLELLSFFCYRNDDIYVQMPPMKNVKNMKNMKIESE